MKDDEFITFEALICQLPGHAYWLDCNNVYQGCNDLQAESFGLVSRKDIVGKTNRELQDPSMADICDKNNLAIMNSGVAQILEEPIIWKDGTKGSVLSHKKPLLDKNGKVIGLIGVSEDITARKEEEDQLRRKLEAIDLPLEYILSKMPGHVYWKNKQGIYMGCNDRQALSLGMKYGYEVVGKTDFELTSDAILANNFWENDLRIIKSGLSETVEEEAIVNGKKAVMLSSKTPLKNKSGDILGVIGISFDITERKEIENMLRNAKEQAEVANNAKTRFLEEMRHDIRTPLSGIVGIAELLNTASDKDKAQEYTKWLIASSQELMEFLNNVLESVNSSSGNIPISIQRFNLYETVARVIKLHQAKALEKGLNLVLDFDPTIPICLMGDPIRIYRIVLELLSNALKFTEEGSVDVRVCLSERTDRDIVVRLEIEDTGPGIPQDRQLDLFTRFNRVSPSYQGLYKGSGLGLFIAKTFAEDLEGTLHVQSDGKTGSQFSCLFPLKEVLLQTMPALDA